MNTFEVWRMALTSLLDNRLRAILTTLGIIIGVTAVIAITSLSQGVEAYVADQFSTLGADVITVTTQIPDTPTRDYADPLALSDIAALTNPAVAPSVRRVAAEFNVNATVRNGTESVSLTVTGVTANYAELNNWEVGSGSFITDAQIAARERVAVLGTTTVADLFGSANTSVEGLPIEINGQFFTIVGVMAERSSQGFNDPNQTVLVPIQTAQTRLDNARLGAGDYRVTSLSVQAADSEAVDAATDEVTAYYMQTHNILYEGDEDFDLSNQGSILSSVTQITSILTIFLGMVAGISLVVGGIGIMNIMLVSVSERTKEIGLRKALGARPRDILSQFLVESVLLSLVGGAIGVVLAWGLVALVATLVPDFQVGVSAGSIGLATGVSTFIGVFFGFYPAQRASALSPIQALRAE